MSIDNNIKFTDKQGQYLAFIYYYTKINKKPPAQADMQKFFNVTPSTVHQMILQLESKNLINKTPGEARSITINIPIELIPQLN